jgi:hypothetical protein
MNIYWFRIYDYSIHHAILAPDEKTAREIFPTVEKDRDISEFHIVGVSLNVHEGEPRALAILTEDNSTEIYQ